VGAGAPAPGAPPPQSFACRLSASHAGRIELAGAEARAFLPHLTEHATHRHSSTPTSGDRMIS